MPVRKQYTVRIYAPDGATPVRTLTTARPADPALPFVKSVPTFSARINGGLGECVLDLFAPFDDFGEGTLVGFMNVVTVDAVVTDTDLKSQTTTRIYKGFVSRYEPYVE